MKVQLVRHATLMVDMRGLRILVDPMFSEAGTIDPAANTVPVLKNPLVDLPDNIDLNSLRNVDAVFITHTHRDHFDDAAVRLLPDNIPIFCQPQDNEKIMDAGFTNVTAVGDTALWQGIRITRTSGRHGTGEIGEKMGPVSGFVIEATNEPILYITGDTIWCQDVADACKFNPDVIVAFSGGAEFLTGGPITMAAEDVYHLSTAVPNSLIVAVHMESWNHCLVSRDSLRSYLDDRGAGERVLIPNDGETLEFLVVSHPQSHGDRIEAAPQQGNGL